MSLLSSQGLILICLVLLFAVVYVSGRSPEAEVRQKTLPSLCPDPPVLLLPIQW